jgi:hypothetical protein
MNNKFTPQYLDYIDLILKSEATGQLVNLTRMYEDYGRLRYKSPRRLLNTKYYKDMLEDEIQELKYEVERVIVYKGEQIYANHTIALKYLHKLDRKNYRRLRNLLRQSSGIGRLFNELPKDENKLDSGTDYTELPF